MANLAGYKPLSNPDWITLQFDDGTESNPVNDPMGEYRTQVDEIARKVAGKAPDPMANATASLGGELTQGAGTGMKVATDVGPQPLLSRPGAAMPGAVPTGPPVAPGGAADGGGLAMGIKAVGKASTAGGDPAIEEAIASQTPPPAPGQPAPPPAPDAPTAPAKPPGLIVTDSSNSWQKTKSEQRGTTGISDEDRPGVVAANESSIAAIEQGNEADYAAKANQLWTEWGRFSDQAKQRVAEKAVEQEKEREYTEQLNTAYKGLDATAARKVDPAQAFAGEKGWYAFMAGFGDVLRNVGAALAGKAPVVDPGAVMDQLVERSVGLQLAQKEADYKAGKISVDRLTADRETTRHKIGLVMTQLAEAELGKAQSQQQYQALGAFKAKGDAIVADARAKAATALARQETKTVNENTMQGGTVQRGLPKPAGSGDPLGDASKMLDIERKQLELRNARLDSATTDDVSAAIGKNVSPDRAKQIRDTVKENAVPLAKLGSFMGGMKEQLRINGATVDWDTGKVLWPKDLTGVSAVKPSDVVGNTLSEQLDTNESRLNRQMEFNKELLTTDTTGAVATPEQGETFRMVLGGAGRNEEAYKAAVESTVKYLVSRQQGYLTAMGEDGSKLYRSNEDKLKTAKTANMKPLGTLPENRR